MVSDLDRAESFYRAALGFATVARGRLDARAIAALGGDAGETAAEIRLRLGEEEISLVQFASPGRAYPADSRSDDLWFQHLAIVVRDMPEAYAALEAYAARDGGRGSPLPDWRPISRGGPQTLPASNGGVRAFKFRDPDGHPLELLWFPPGAGRACWHELAAGAASSFLGIDHSALAVRSTARSVEFYGSLGLHTRERTLNAGPAQSRLDGLEAAQVEVTSLRPPSAEGPGIELLAYRPGGRTANLALTDLASDWIVAAAHEAGPADAVRAVTDPDGHRLLLVNP